MDNLPGKFNRSGGPRSTDGKVITSRNALKSGAYAKYEFIDGETNEQLENLRQALYEDLRPQTSVERALVEDILWLLWRKFRIERYSSSALKSIYEKEVTKADIIGDLGVDALEMLVDIQEMSDDIRRNGKDFYSDFLRKIQSIQVIYPKNCPDLPVFKREHSEIYQLMRTLSQSPEYLDNQIRANKSLTPKKTFWEEELQSLEIWARKWIKCFDSETKILQVILRIQRNRIYQHLISNDAARATDDVSRALHRALREYYKERDRYRRDSAMCVDLRPEHPAAAVITDDSAAESA